MLTTVDRITAYLGVAGTGAQASKLTRLAYAASDMVTAYIGRDVKPATKAVTSTPNPNVGLFIIPDPVARLVTVRWGNANQPISEFTFETIRTSTHVSGKWPDSPVMIAYRRGFTMMLEGAITRTVNAPTLWLENVSVMIDGVTAVPADTPASGQYSVLNGAYSFSQADLGKSYAITYCHVPPALEQAVIDLVAYADAGTSRIGVVSKSLGGQETVSFSQEAMTPSARLMLAPYRAVHV